MIEAEGGVFLDLLDRMDLLSCEILPTVADMRLAVAAAEFIVRAGEGDCYWTLPEMAVLDAANAFLAIVANPLDEGSWETLRSIRSMFPKVDGDDSRC